MKLKYLLPCLLSLLTLVGCKDDEPGGGETPKSGKYSLSGKVEKGPFVRGSVISVQPVNQSLDPIGTVFNGEIQDNAGTFDLGKIDLASQFVRIASDGYYFNEVRGSLSQGQLHLIAYADLSDRSSVNVNILTHLKSARIQTLMKSGKTYAEANKQAHKELLTQFGLQAYENLPAEAMTVTGGNDGAGVLIAISALVLDDRSEANVTEFISNLTQDLADDGEFGEYALRSLSQSRSSFKNNNTLELISQHIIDRYEELGQSISVPDLRLYIDWNGDGIAGNEINDNPQITLSQTEVSFPKEGGSVEINVTSNIPLSLEPTEDPWGDNNGGWVIGPSDNFFEGGEPIQMRASYENGKLKIFVDRSKNHFAETKEVYLYNLLNEIAATVKVTLAGDPSVDIKLSSFGSSLCSGAFIALRNAYSSGIYITNHYTGLEDSNIPRNEFLKYFFSRFESENNECFQQCYTSITKFTSILNGLKEKENAVGALPFFRFFRALTYLDMAEKWGRIGISTVIGEVPCQSTQAQIFAYIETELIEIEAFFSDKKSSGDMTGGDSFLLSKDIWRMALANLYLAKEDYNKALPLLQSVYSSNRYSVVPGSENLLNAGSIFQLFWDDYESKPWNLPEGRLSIFTATDLLLSLAECQYRQGNSAEATALIKKVATAKGVSLSGSIIADINTIRSQFKMPRYFAFQKRNNLGGYEEYQKLWMIPRQQIMMSNWTQNPGY